MPKIAQNLVVLMEPNETAFRKNVSGGNKCLNRFCINEETAFELSGVYYFNKEPSGTISVYEKERDFFEAECLKAYKS